MMTSFKVFLAEINHDDGVYNKDTSDHVANFKVDDTWSPVPLKGPFWKPGYRCVWKPNPYRAGYKLAVTYNRQTVVYLELRAMKKRVPGGELIGVEVDSLSSVKRVRGTGLALRTYEALVESGQVLFSSDTQTSGSRQLWERLVTSPKVVPFVLAEGEAAMWYIDRYGSDDLKEKPPANVLLTGPMSKMVDEAYASQETRWVALPTDLERLNALRENAIVLR
jgi:hypothetical protein